MSPVTVTWNLRYTNTNPNPSTICDHCRQFIGHVFPTNQRPLLPMHPSCYCIYEPTTAPVTWDVDWDQYFADLQENDPQAYRQWVQRAAWFLRKMWPLGIMEALRQAAERYNEEEYEPRATQGVEHMYDTNPTADIPAPATPDAQTPASGENIGNHPSPSQNAALRAPQSVALGPVTLQANEDGPPQYDAILVQPGWIRKSDGTDSDWLIPADVLQTAADSGLFASVSHYVDHPKLFGFGWPQSHSIRDLAGLVTHARWDHELGAVRGTIRLYDTDAGQLLQTIYDQILADQEAGLDVPPIGLSAVVYRKYKIDKESGKNIWTEIRKVESVDLVYEPGAAGYIRAALATVPGTWQSRRSVPGTLHTQSSEPTGGHTMEEETTLTQETPGELNNVQPTPAPEPQTSTQAPVQDPEQTTLERIRQNIETLNGVVARLSSHVVSQAEQQTIQGMGDPPREPTLYGGYTGLDRVEMALDAMLSGTRPPDGVRPLTGIRELYMLLSGDYELTGRFHPDRVHLANVTTSTMAGLVANRLNKVVVNMFQQYDRWWAPAVTIRDFATLQDVRWITLGGVGELPTVAEGAAYTEMTWDDQTETDSFVKKGGYLGITLETIDKDDTSRVMAAPRALAQAAWLTLGKAIAEVFTANSGAGPAMSDSYNLFDNSNHSNYGSTALSYAAWKATVILMMKYTEVNSSERLGALTRPRLLWVPIDLEDTAIEILAAGEGEIGTADYHVNPETLAETHRERVRLARNRVITVPFWTNTTDWVAQADPAMYPGLGLGFRYGRTPEIFSVADPRAGLMFTNDTMPIKVRFFFAVGPTDYRAFYKHNV